MAQGDSVSGWLEMLQTGDAAAAQRLWERYFHRLVGLAAVKLNGRVRRAAADEEDVALSAFASFCRAAKAGCFPQLNDRDDLWRLLVTLTERKALNMIRDANRQKRGGGNVGGESVLLENNDPAKRGLEQLAGREPTPEFAAQVAEECERLLGLLDDAELKAIALWKMEGETVPAIANRLSCAVSTVERRLRLIRQIWEEAPA